MVANDNTMNIEDIRSGEVAKMIDSKDSSDNTPQVEKAVEVDCEKSVLNEQKDEVSADSNKNRGNNAKKILEKGITGTVRWFNVRMGYGFIKRNDNNEDIYVYYQSIAKKNPEKRLKSLATDEEVVFDIFEGKKGNEAWNVTGPNGEPVKGSHIDSRYKKNHKGYRRLPYYLKKFNMINKEKDPNRKVVEEKVQGEVLFFNIFKGYGFIKRNDTGDNVFCHIVDIVKSKPKKFNYLPSGTCVLFDIVEGLKGPEASYVTDKEGKPIYGIKKRNRKSKKAAVSTNLKEKEEKEKSLKKIKKNGKNKKTKKDESGESQVSSEKENKASIVGKNNESSSNNNVMVETKTIQPLSDASLIADKFEDFFIQII